MPAYGLLWPIYEHVALAVQMFWLISGFVFMAVYGASGKSVSFRTFFAHRVARLYPLHLATLIVVAIVQMIGMHSNGQWQVYGNNDVSHFVAQLFFASNWLDAKEASFNAPIWSVSVEVLIYGLFVVYLRLFGAGLISAVCAAMALFAIERMTYAPLAWCGALFFIGATLARISPSFFTRFGRVGLIAAGLATALGIVAIALLARLGYGGHEATFLSYFVMPPFLLFLAGLDEMDAKFPRSLLWIGTITYSVYLLHMPLIIGIKTIFPGRALSYTLLGSAWTMVAYIIAVVCLALVVTYKFEIPAQKIVRKWFAPRVQGTEG